MKKEKNQIEEPAPVYSTTHQSFTGNLLISDKEDISFAERKSVLINAILNDVKDEKILEELELLIFSTIYQENAPCQYSIEELQERIEESVKQIEEGNYYTHEQMKEMYKTWK